MPTVQAAVYAGFITLPVVVAGLVAWVAKSWRLTLSILAWMLIAAVLALSGTLNHFRLTPPPVGLLLVSGFIATVALGMSGWIARLMALPLSALIAAQAFRILVEILIHQSSTIGLAPRQMTWDGYNFDVVTGITALALAPFARIAPIWLIATWNSVGLALLLWVVGIAAVSLPTAYQLLRPDNAWVAFFPYVWLPSILVTAALLGHIVVFRKLAKQSPLRTAA